MIWILGDVNKTENNLTFMARDSGEKSLLSLLSLFLKEKHKNIALNFFPPFSRSVKVCPDIPSLISRGPACLPSGQAEEMDNWISAVTQHE